MIAGNVSIFSATSFFAMINFLNNARVADCFLINPAPQTTSARRIIILSRNQLHAVSFKKQLSSVPFDQHHNFSFQRYSHSQQEATPEFENESSSPPVETSLGFKKRKLQKLNDFSKTSTLPSFLDREERIIQSALEIAHKEDEKKSEKTIILDEEDKLQFLPSKEVEQRSTQDQVSLSENIILLLGSSSIVMLLSKGLSSFELLQDWRYSWCLIGCLYIWDGLQNNIPILVPSKSKLFNILEVICGIGLLIGGAYDIFMPVYMTGPNVFTSAGIHQDSATILLGVTFYKFSTSSLKSSPSKMPFSALTNSMKAYDLKLLHMILLAQLYILGESSIDELLSYFA